MTPRTRSQGGVITRRQALADGLTSRVIHARVERGQWQALHRGIYATFSGPVPRLSRLWAAVLAAGPGATLSHHTAAELAGIVDDQVTRIHLTIPAERRIKPPAGCVIHHSVRVDRARQPARQPPRTKVEETVIDLADRAASVDAAIGWCTAAVGRRLTTPRRLREALDDRPRARWRSEMAIALSDLAGGAMSPLELRYLNDVERRHGLPTGNRQVRHRTCGRTIYDDVNYVEYGLVIELDGKIAHPSERQADDRARDNVAGERADSVLHYGWAEVTGNPCDVAKRVAHTLRLRGWTGGAHACRRPGCDAGPRPRAER